MLGKLAGIKQKVTISSTVNGYRKSAETCGEADMLELEAETLGGLWHCEAIHGAPQAASALRRSLTFQAVTRSESLRGLGIRLSLAMRQMVASEQPKRARTT